MDPAYLSELCRFLLTIVLTTSAFGKTAEFRGFVASLADGLGMPASLGRPVALGVVGGEWLAAAGLMLGGTLGRAGAGLALLMFTAFSAWMLAAIVSGRRLACRCFGRAAHPVSWLDLARNALYIAAAAFCLFHHSAPLSASGPLVRPSLFLAALWCFLVSIHLREITRLLSGRPEPP